MGIIASNISEIKDTLPENVKLIAVSKNHPKEDITEAYQAGQRIFGENKAQELSQKHAILPTDIEWHFIGHLQTNKIKYIAPFVSLIHGVDSFRLLQEINREAKKNNRIIPCLLQFHIASEDTKFGFNLEEAKAMLFSDAYAELNHIKIIGVMGMATYTEDETIIRNEFRQLANYFKELKSTFFSEQAEFKEISMGMSDDYPIAIEEGSTMVRVGTAIFGARNYQ